MENRPKTTTKIADTEKGSNKSSKIWTSSTMSSNLNTIYIRMEHRTITNKIYNAWKLITSRIIQKTLELPSIDYLLRNRNIPENTGTNQKRDIIFIHLFCTSMAASSKIWSLIIRRSKISPIGLTPNKKRSKIEKIKLILNSICYKIW